MSYLVLARKYRPRTFADVTGQEVVTRTLQGAIEEGRIGHAYLLCGPRGTGKTTTARIFAKALNCEQGPTPEPCGVCGHCQAADAGNEPDLIEIDAASNNGVEHVRALREQAAYAPLKARHKVYLLDEVHMLSKAAFNALLKTLEEPPPHVKFLFATTEPHKLPDTILSRCQVLKLSTLTEEAITQRLEEVFRLEQVEADPGVCAAIARRARGGMRDALSLADQLLALVGDKPTLEDTERLAAGADPHKVELIVNAIVQGERGTLLEELAALQGGERELVDALMLYLRGCLLSAHCGEDNPISDAPLESRHGMAELARELGADRIELMLEDLLHAREQMRTLPGQAPLILELALLQLSRAEATISLAGLAQRLHELELRLEGGAGAPPAVELTPQAAPATSRPRQAAGMEPARSTPVHDAPGAVAPAPRARPQREGTATAPAPSQEPVAPRRQRPQFAGAVKSSKGEAWKRFVEELAEKAPALGELLATSGKLLELGDGRAVVRFEKLRDSGRLLVQDARNQKLCSRVFSDLMGAPVAVHLEDGSELSPGVGDKFTREVRDLFDGRIED